MSSPQSEPLLRLILTTNLPDTQSPTQTPLASPLSLSLLLTPNLALSPSPLHALHLFKQRPIPTSHREFHPEPVTRPHTTRVHHRPPLTRPSISSCQSLTCHRPMSCIHPVYPSAPSEPLTSPLDPARAVRQHPTAAPTAPSAWPLGQHVRRSRHDKPGVTCRLSDGFPFRETWRF